MTLTSAQQGALKWLDEHGGDAVFNRRGVALAQGEEGFFMRATWNRLEDAGMVEFYGGRLNRSRMRITVAGKANV